jgi:integrase
MFSHSTTGVKVLSVLDNRRSLADGNYPIRIRVTFKRTQKYFSTGISFSQAEWDRINGTKNKKLIESREIIQGTFNHIKNVIDTLIKEDEFSFTLLNNRLGLGVDHSLNLIFTSNIDDLNKQGKHNTSDWYKYSLKALASFGGSSIMPSSITPEWLKKYEKHLLAENKSYTTISMYMRSLRAILNVAKDQGLIKLKDYPFGVAKGKYQIPQHEKRNLALTIKQVGEVVNYQCSTDFEKFCRDLWFFSYLCNGANITDILQLTKDNVKGNTIQFYRQKTKDTSKVKKLIVAEITPQMQAILSEHGSTTGKYLFPILTGKETSLEKLKKTKGFTRSLNHYMTKIGGALHIGSITSYTSRHSFATVLKRSGANIAYISESLGHTDVKTTDNYLDSFEDEERIKNSKHLTNF